MNFIKIISLLSIFVLVIGCVSSDKEETKIVHAEEKVPIKVDSSKFLFDINLEDYCIDESEVNYGETLGKLLNDKGISSRVVFNLAEASKDILDVRDIKVGKPYMILSKKDSVNIPAIFVYQASAVDYYLYHFKDTIKVEHKKKEIEIRKVFASGEIQGSLSATMSRLGLSQKLVMLLADGIYPWQINFFAVQPGDKFKVIYDAKYVDGKFIGIGDLHASNFYHRNRDFYAIEFNKSYYDENSRNLRAFFLQAPVQFSRISSRYQRRRKHPVTGRIKAHKGTDFAAPKNTPIYSTADGVITHAKYKRNNGNYVKVKHNKTYTTQYLHMNKIAKGIKPGVMVKQGEVIGYVGKTGLATGYHVCYRFWYNGKQVDPFKMKFPPSKDLEEKYKAPYLKTKNKFLSILNKFSFTEGKVNVDNLFETKEIKQDSLTTDTTTINTLDSIGKE